jgi:hypothetical protein
MTRIPKHINWLINTGEKLRTADGKEVELWEFKHQQDESTLSEWASHFRNQYCLDIQIDILRKGTGLSRTDYLKQMKFPDSSMPPGPSIRVGDFTEILVADFLEHLLKYWVPRFRYTDKTIRNESKKGSDTIGFLFSKEGESSPKDKLAIFESKAQYSGKRPNPILQDAIDDSAKDITRKGESLNAIKQRYLDIDDIDCANKVARFQNEVDNPYTQMFGAVAHWDSKIFDPTIIDSTSTVLHPFAGSLFLVVIKGDEMMSLVHDLYRRAADEA